MVPVSDHFKHYMVEPMLASWTDVTQGCVTCSNRAGLQGTSRVLWGLDCRRGAGGLPRTTASSTWWSPCCKLERSHTRVCHQWQESWVFKVPGNYRGSAEEDLKQRWMLSEAVANLLGWGSFAISVLLHDREFLYPDDTASLNID